MAGPLPHVPPLSPVPHPLPPLLSSDPDLDHTNIPLREVFPDPPPSSSITTVSGVLPLPSSAPSGSLHPPPPLEPLLSDPRVPELPFVSGSSSSFSGDLVHRNLSTSSQTHQPPPPPPAPTTVPPDPFPPLPLATPSSAPSTNLLPIPSSSLPVDPPPQPPLPVPPASSIRPDSSSGPPPVIPPKGLISRHHQQSYAQVARGSRGPGFVRSHASDVEHFARLPRTGANIICGSHEGLPSFSFMNSDLPRVEELYSKALVMKFLGGRPSLESSHKEISSWGIEHPFSIGPLTSRAFLLRFQDDTDLLKVLSRPSSSLITFPYKIYRWHNLCHLREDSCLAPVWISLPRLPLQCFIPEFLESVANNIGRFLCLDKATATLARPSAARMCVELDLSIPPPMFIWVGLFDGFKQPILYEKLPKFCHGCYAQGHSDVECSKKSLDNPNHQPSTRNPPNKSSTPTARHYAAANPISGNEPIPSSTNTHPTPPSPQIAILGVSTNTAAADQHTCKPSHQFQAQQSEPNPPDPSGLASEPQLQSKNPDQQRHIPSKQPAQQHNPLQSSIQSSHRQSKIKQKRSVAFEQHQSNLEANQVFWGAVNRQMAILDQARLKAPAVESSIPNHPTENPPPLNRTVDKPTTLQDEGSNSGSSVAEDTQSRLPSPSFQEGQYHHDAYKSSLCHSVNSAAKPIKLKHLDVDQGPSLTQQQQDALERFKKKVRAQTQNLGQQLIGPISANLVTAPLQAQSDEDEDEYMAATYNSDTDDGFVEPIDMGYQSADGRSSHNHIKSSASVMKINKRHPNIPLNVRLRTRKHS